MGLRFASLVRVSTDRQSVQGESLHTQTKGNARDVERLEGTIVATYGGAEHATPGWEKAEVDRLLADAAKGLWDAVICQYADRWSRDNAKSEAGLDVFRQHGIRFYVGTMEMDLFNPEHCLILGMNAVIGRFLARKQAKMSLENRIERARRGIPTCGKRPWGRTFNRDLHARTGQGWVIDPAKADMIKDVARRYLDGENLAHLAAEYGTTRGVLFHVLKEKCGSTWSISFRSEALNIDEVVTLAVPALLDAATIRDVHDHMTARRTYLHPTPCPVHEYALSGRVFCGCCGYALNGKVSRSRTTGKPYRYYAHNYLDGAGASCTLRPRPHVEADWLEEEVVSRLFGMFGNPAQIKQAITAAVPDCDGLVKRRFTLAAELDKLTRGRERLLGLIVKGVLTDEQAESQLGDMRDREARLRQELDRLAVQLGSVPSEADIQVYVEKVGSSIFLYDDNGDMDYPGGNCNEMWFDMGPDDRRKLIEAVFSRPLPDGTPSGVYVSVDPAWKGRQRKRWHIAIRGQMEFEAVLNAAKPGERGRKGRNDLSMPFDCQRRWARGTDP
jgi:DNA invertase Pin-like site-specific DNA recombinase